MKKLLFTTLLATCLLTQGSEENTFYVRILEDNGYIANVRFNTQKFESKIESNPYFKERLQRGFLGESGEIIDYYGAISNIIKATIQLPHSKEVTKK